MIGLDARHEKACPTGEHGAGVGAPVEANAAPPVLRLGFWAAAAAAALGAAYVALQIAEWSGLLGSRGGPESSSTWSGLIALLTPSLLLGPVFLVLMVCVHRISSPARKLFSHVAVAFATAYVCLTGMVYFVQLTLIAPHMARGQTAGLEPFLFVPFDSFLYAVDILGYTLMSVATLFAAQAFCGGGVSRAARWLLIANGLLAPFIALQMYWHWLIWVASLWAATFPAATIALALWFRREAQINLGDP